MVYPFQLGRKYRAGDTALLLQFPLPERRAADVSPSGSQSLYDIRSTGYSNVMVGLMWQGHASTAWKRAMVAESPDGPALSLGAVCRCPGKVCGWHSMRVNGTQETELSARLHLSGTTLVFLLDADDM